MNSDILSELLSSVRVGAALRCEPGRQPGTGHMMQYRLGERGDAWLTLDGAAPVHTSQGCLLMLRHKDGHMAQRMAALLALLPPSLHLPAEGDGTWIHQAMRQAIANVQAGHPGAQAVLDRGCEMMLIGAVQRQASLQPQAQGGLLGGLRDRQVGRALALIHEQPANAWTVGRLATDVAMSRSAFCEHFARLVGQPPMQYLTNWRMELASSLLRQNRAPIATIAFHVGYESEAAFTRAFKRLLGTPPARWRRDQLAAA